MSSLAGDAKVTRTYFLYPLERSPDALSPEEYEQKFLEAIAESFRAFRSDHVPLPEVVLKDTNVARRFFGIERICIDFAGSVITSLPPPPPGGSVPGAFNRC